MQQIVDLKFTVVPSLPGTTSKNKNNSAEDRHTELFLAEMLDSYMMQKLDQPQSRPFRQCETITSKGQIILVIFTHLYWCKMPMVCSSTTHFFK